MHSAAEARHEVENLLSRYAERADSLDAPGVSELFANAQVSFAGRYLPDTDAIRQHYEALFASASPSRHLLNNIQVAQRPGSAEARCHYMRWSLTDPPQLVSMGSYRATFHHAEGRWQFAAFTVERDWQDPTPSAPPAPATQGAPE